MINVTDTSCAITGPTTEVLSQMTMAINAVVNSLARRGADKEILKPLFYHMVDVAFSLGTACDGTTIDLSFERRET